MMAELRGLSVNVHLPLLHLDAGDSLQWLNQGHDVVVPEPQTFGFGEELLSQGAHEQPDGNILAEAGDQRQILAQDSHVRGRLEPALKQHRPSPLEHLARPKAAAYDVQKHTRVRAGFYTEHQRLHGCGRVYANQQLVGELHHASSAVSYTHLRAHETR